MSHHDSPVFINISACIGLIILSLLGVGICLLLRHFHLRKARYSHSQLIEKEIVDGAATPLSNNKPILTQQVSVRSLAEESVNLGEQGLALKLDRISSSLTALVSPFLESEHYSLVESP